MARSPTVRVLLVLAVLASLSACGPRLTVEEARAVLAAQLGLDADRLRVGSVSDEALPVASIDYAGVAAAVRFRHEKGAWAVDALRDGTRWTPAAGGVAALAAQLKAQVQAKWTDQAMPRYAGTLKLLVGWTSLLMQQCDDGFPTSPASLLTLHAMWRRALFANRGGEFHNPDLFQRDGWWKLFRVTLTADRVEVQSSGADGRMDTDDDMGAVYVRKRLAGKAAACWARYRMPAFAIDALGRADAPAAWNCATLVATLMQAEKLAAWGK